ncbi:hypothetical protein [Staphylococcus phage APTC_SA_12]|nr:MAG: hypothetical protein [Staphylococcus phage RP2]UWV20397.1 hypothetical protein [Staphylococcus phage APTC_SA_12]WPH67317.1 hypothetical protein CUBM_gp158c [Staphylococcus phage CUB-M]
MFLFISPNSFYHIILLSIFLIDFVGNSHALQRLISFTLLSYSLIPLGTRYLFDSR